MMNNLLRAKISGYGLGVKYIRILVLNMVLFGVLMMPVLAQDQALQNEGEVYEEVVQKLEEKILKEMENNHELYYKEGAIDTTAYEDLFFKILNELFVEDSSVETGAHLNYLFAEREILRRAGEMVQILEWREKNQHLGIAKVEREPEQARADAITEEEHDQIRQKEREEQEQKRLEEQKLKREEEILSRIRESYQKEEVVKDEAGQEREIKIEEKSLEEQKNEYDLDPDSGERRGEEDEYLKEREEEILQRIRKSYQLKEDPAPAERDAVINYDQPSDYTWEGERQERSPRDSAEKLDEEIRERVENTYRNNNEVRALDAEREPVMSAMSVAANETDSLALVALYNATDGDNWGNNSNWLQGNLDAWYGVTVNEAGRVTELNLSWNELSGELPSEIGDLSALSYLNLYRNNLEGSLPGFLSQLTNLTYLDLGSNDFTGTVPEEWANFDNLNVLFINDNDLGGILPTGFTNLMLKTLHLGYNSFDQQVLNQVSQITTLENLYLRGNNFDGTIPAELADLSNLVSLDLAFNDFVGTIPEDMKMLELTFLNLSGNSLDIQVVKDVSEIISLEDLYLGRNNFGGIIPSEITNLENLEFLNLNYNQLEGGLPTGFSNLQIKMLNIGGNLLDEQVMLDVSQTQSLEQLYLYNNGFEGNIPPELANLTNLWRLELSENPFTGDVPEEIAGLSNLEQLYVDETELNGLPDLSGLISAWIIDTWNSRFTFEDLVPNKDVANNFSYSPQKPFGQPQIIEPELSTEVTFGVDLDYEGNKYQWYKDGTLLEGETGTQITLPSIKESDLGEYVAQVTNPALPDLTLESEPINLVPAGIQEAIEADSLALVALYNATGGPNWNTNNNWLDGPIDTWQGVTTNSIGRVIELSLIFNGDQMSGELPNEIGDLDALRVLELYVNDLSGPLPVEIGQLSDLIILNLGDNNFTGSIPQEWVNLTKLEYLTLGTNNLEGTLPAGFTELPLTYLDLEWNGFDRQVLVDAGSISTLESLHMAGNSFGGTIPSELVQLTQLRDLNLVYNQLEGGLPAGFTGLPLVYLNLEDNSLDKEIFDDISQITSIQRLYLGYNQFGGTIPENLTQLTSLESLGLADNQFEGGLPTSFTGLPLTYLNLSRNLLDKQVLIDLGDMANLRDLYLRDNGFEGTIPPELANLTNLYTLDLSNNLLVGNIPDEIANLSNLRYLYVDRTELSGLPDFSSLTNMWRIRTEYSRFTFEDLVPNKDVPNYFYYNPQKPFGQPQIIEPELGTEVTIGIDLDYEGNEYQWYKDGTLLEGETSTQITLASITESDFGEYIAQVTNPALPDLTLESEPINLVPAGIQEAVEADSLALVALYNATGGPNWNTNNNWLDGPIDNWQGVTTNSIGRVVELQLRWNYDNMSGELPEEIGNLDALRVLDLNSNNLSGSLPSTIAQMNDLAYLSLGWNEFTGIIPAEWASLTKLEYLNLGGNNLEGAFPDGFTELPLNYLALEWNGFDREVLVDAGSMQTLVSLHLSVNNFGGTIPTELTELTNLRYLSLRENQLEGGLPPEFTNLPLVLLDLGSNQLDRQVFDDIGEMTSLRDLYLFGNGFGGNIPENLTQLTNLERLGLSGNQLEGGLPDGFTELPLWHLNLSYNSLDEQVLTDLGGMGTLEDLYLENNGFEGAIPPELANLANLSWLDLSENPLVGDVPEGLANLSNLRYLYVDRTELSGLPDFSSLTNMWRIRTEYSRFTFEDLVPNKDVPNYFYYNPQKPFGQPQIIEPELGTEVTIGIDLDYEGNEYQWYKDGILLEGETSTQITLPSITESDFGEYIAQVTNPALPDLTLESEPINLVPAGLQEAIEADSLALVALYNATGGPNWNTNNNWLNGPIDTWQGITTNSLGRVIELNLRYNYSNMSGELPSEIGDLDALRYLNLQANNLMGDLPIEIGQLNNLINLNLSGNDFSGSIPNTWINLSSLKSLYLYNNNLEGVFPDGFNNVPLTLLSLGGNQFDRQVLIQASQISTLSDLYAGGNNFGGVIPTELSNLEYLTHLELFGNAFEGSIPTSFENLPLILLNLRSNKLAREALLEISKITTLQRLYIDNNGFNGTMPSELGLLTNLQQLTLASNNLEGTIPEALKNLSIKILNFGGNQLDIEVLTDVSEISTLERLYLWGNDLIGSIPDELGNLSNLEFLNLSDNNLTGRLPSTLSSLSNLENLYLDRNPLEGAVPEDFTNLSSLRYVYLYDTNLDSLPDLSSLSNMWTLSVRNSKFTFDDLVPNEGVATNFFYSPQRLFGELQVYESAIGANLTFGVDLDYEGNEYSWYKDGELLTGETSTEISISSLSEEDYGEYMAEVKNPALPDLTLQSEPIILQPIAPATVEADSLALVELYNTTNGDQWTNNGNWLTEKVSKWHGISLNENGKVIAIELNDNNLTGQLPVELTNLTELERLSLYSNELQGTIPLWFQDLTKLVDLNLGGNQYEGSIPSELGNLVMLEYLNLAQNNLEGSIPSELGQLTNLINLNLYSNNLLDSIPSEIGQLSKIEVLSLSYNSLEGSIPIELGQLDNLRTLYLSNNNFSGSIPSEIGQLTALVDLQLSNNNLTGSIPPELGNLTNVVTLYLHENNLTGEIPVELSNLQSVEQLALVWNDLEGDVPSELASLNTLRYLYLADNNLTNLPDLSPLENLELLWIQEMNLTFKDIIPNVGVASNTFNYIPQNPIVIDNVPAVTVGEEVTFGIGLDYEGNEYQWYKDGTLLEGETSQQITIASVASGDFGEYQVKVTNSALPDLTLESEVVTIEDPNWEPDPITIRDLNTYDQLNSTEDLPNHPMVGEEVEFTAVIVSHPKNSGLARYHPDTDMIDRLHTFVVDTSANSMGKDGMYMQIVSSGDVMKQIEDLSRGDIVTFTGTHNFFGKEVQLSPTSAEYVGSVFEGMGEYSELLEPTVITTDELNELAAGGQQIKLANYGKYVNRYVKVESAIVEGSLPISTGTPWFYFQNSEGKVYFRGTSLRYDNRWARYRTGYNYRREEDGVFEAPIEGSEINISGFATLYHANTDEGGIKVNTTDGLFSIVPWDDGIVWTKQDGNLVRTTPTGWPDDLEIISEPEAPPVREYEEIMVSELNTYDQLSSIDEIPNHPRVGENVSFTAVILSEPRNSGYAGYSSALSVEINRLHTFVVDTSANSKGKDGMYMQVVSYYDAITQMEQFTRGDIVKIKGRYAFYQNQAQFEPDSILYIGSVSDDFSNYANLLKPSVITADKLIVPSESGFKSNLNNYTKYVNRYVRIEKATVGGNGSLNNDDNRPWLFVNNEGSKIYTKDMSLRYRNDRNEYRQGYNLRRNEDGAYIPPEPGETVNLSGFVTFLETQFDPAGLNADPSTELLSVAPWDDGVLWVEENGSMVRTEPTDWPDDLEVIEEGEVESDFTLVVNTSDENDNNINLTIGTAPDATTGFDDGYDQYAPPEPPSGSFDGRIRAESDDFLSFFQPTTTTSTEWTLRLQGASGSSSLTLEWDPESLPQEGMLMMSSLSAGLDGINMAGQSSITISNNEAPDVIITHSLTEEYQLSYNEGWNLVGLALDQPHENFSELFTQAISGTLFGFDGAYTASETLTSGEGYWLRFSSPEDVTLEGTRPEGIEQSLQSGWNLVAGHVGCNPACQMTDPDGVVISGTTFGFEGAYQSASELSPGRGYWVRASGEGTVGLESAPQAKVAKTNIRAGLGEDYHRIELREGEQHSTSLYFGEASEQTINPEQTLLPPAPPGGAFDARLGSDRWLEHSDSVQVMVQQQGTTVMELTLSESTPEKQFRITEYIKGQSPVETILEESGSLELNTSTTTLTIEALNESELVEQPEEFALLQNYPNPFNPTTTINYSIPEPAEVVLEVYNIMGQRVQRLVNTRQTPGHYTVTFEAGHLASGVYLYRLKAGTYMQSRRMILLK